MSRTLDRLVVTVANAAMLVRHWRVVFSFRRHVGRWPRLCPPASQNDKFFWRKAFDHNPMFQVFCDKLACKEWVREHCPDVLVPETLWQGQSAGDIPDHLLMRPAFIKANNGSSYNVRIDGNSVDRKTIETSFLRWLSRPYGQGNAEWGYRNVPRKVFVEEAITASGGISPVMIEVYAAGGKPAAALCVTGWKDGPRQGAFFDQDGNRVPVQPEDIPRLPDDWQPPAGFGRAIEYSRVLVRDMDQIRCDFMCVDDKVWFSEMTPYTLSGMEQFGSSDQEDFIYSAWDLRQSWFLSTSHRGWKRVYAGALRRML